MEKDNFESKRKSSSESSEEPPDKKMRHHGSIEEILPPFEERNKDSSAHSIQQVVDNSGPSKIDTPQNDNDNPTTSDDPANNTSDREAKSESNKDPVASADPNDESPLPQSTHSSVEEITGIRLSRVITSDKSLDEKPSTEDGETDGKKIKFQCDRHSSDHGNQSTDADTITTPIVNTADPQTSTSSLAPPRNKCAYGAKCYRKSSGHKATYSHPGDSDYDIKDDRPECRYGIKCYRKDPKHKQDFKHTVIRRKRAQTPVRAAAPKAYESFTDHSSVEESVDESEYDPSGLDCSTDDFDDDYDDDNSDW